MAICARVVVHRDGLAIDGEGCVHIADSRFPVTRHGLRAAKRALIRALRRTVPESDDCRRRIRAVRALRLPPKGQ